MSASKSDELQKKVADLNLAGVFYAELNWQFDTAGTTVTEIYGLLSFGWAGKPHHAEFSTAEPDGMAAVLDTLIGLTKLKGMN